MSDDQKLKLDRRIEKINEERKKLIAQKKRIIARENAQKRKQRNRMLILLGAGTLEALLQSPDGGEWLKKTMRRYLKPNDAQNLIEWWEKESLKKLKSL